MLVKDRMAERLITLTEHSSVGEALQLMREKNVRRFPVLNTRGRLAGIVVEKDLLYASPSPATSLSVWEIPQLLSRLKVRDIMTRNVVTVTEDTPLEEAARIMADSQVGGLPVMRDHELVGIITETDIFKVLLEMMGAREETVRLTVLVPDRKGTLAQVAGRITELGGDILALGTIADGDPTKRQLTVRVTDVSEEQLVSAMEDMALEMLDARYCTTPACAI